MYTNIQVLDKVKHAALTYTPNQDYAFAATTTASVITAPEVVVASSYYPIVFAKEGPVNPLALFGLQDKNEYLDKNGQWTVPFIPAMVRRYPFLLTKDATGEGLYISLDADAPHFQEPGENLIDQGGELSPVGQRVNNFLLALNQDLEKTQGLLQALVDTGVLTDKNLSIRDGETTRMIGGFRSVDEAKVMELDDATLAAWVRSGVMRVLHAHWASLRHLHPLAVATEAGLDCAH